MIIYLNTGNAAFEDGDEASRILRQIALRLAVGDGINNLFDVNGNKVGHVDYVTQPEV